MSNGKPWSADDDRVLLSAADAGVTMAQIAQHVVAGRSEDACAARARFLRQQIAVDAGLVARNAERFARSQHGRALARHAGGMPRAAVLVSYTEGHLFGAGSVR